MRKKITPKRILKIVIGIFVFFTLPALLLFGYVYYKHHEDLPLGNQPEQADILAHKMLETLNYDAYKKANYIEWTFKKKRHYKWNKAENTCAVYWKNYTVNLDFNTPSNNSVLVSKVLASAEASTKLITEAKAYFTEDVFWLVAPYTVFNEGTTRQLVTANNTNSLLVTYKNKEAYVWELNDDFSPKGFKMFNNKLPIDGVFMTWTDWTTVNDVQLPKFHNFLYFGMEFTDIIVK